MANTDTYVWDGLDVNDGVSYFVIGKEFPEPKLKTKYQSFLQAHGGSIIPGTDYYEKANRMVKWKVVGTTIPDLHAKVSALHKKIRSRDTDLTFKWAGASENNYTKIMWAESATPYDRAALKSLVLIVTVVMHCDSFWYQDQETLNRFDTKYDASKGNLPAAEDPAWIKFTSGGSPTETIVSDYLKTVGSGISDQYYLSFIRDCNTIDGVSVEAVIQAVSADSVGNAAIALYDGTYYTHLYINAADIRVGGSTYVMDTTTLKHKYLVTLQNNVVMVYVDDNETPVITNGADSTAPDKALLFGDLAFGGSAAHEERWYSIELFAGGAYTPATLPRNFATESSPAVWPTGTVKGDVQTPGIMEIRGRGTGSIGTNLYVGNRAFPIPETNWNPIRNFTGTAEADTAYGDAYYRKTGIDNGSWYNLAKDAKDTDLQDTSYASAAVGWHVGDAGLVEKTADSGGTYTAQTSNTTANLFGVFAYDTSNAYACGSDGTVITTSDGGTTWVVQETGVGESLNSIFFISATVGWACGIGGRVIYTTDGGVYWAVQDSTTSNPLNSIHFYDANYGKAVGSEVVSTTDGGATWVQQTIPALTYTLFGVQCLSQTVAFACGVNQTIIHTSDWSTWTTKQVKDDATYSWQNVNYYKIDMQSATVGWVTADWGGIYKTTDGTNFVAQRNSSSQVYMKGLSVIDANTVYAAGHGYTIMKTTDGGDTWVEFASSWAISNANQTYKGQYGVYTRVRSADATPASVQMRASVGWAGGDVLTSNAVNLVAGAGWQWVYLGTITLPATKVSDELDPIPSTLIRFEAMGSSGTGYNFDMDVACLLPVDGGAIYVKGSATAASPIIIDAKVGAVNLGATIPKYVGAPIDLNPGDNNVLVLGTNGISPFEGQIKYNPQTLSPVA